MIVILSVSTIAQIKQEPPTSSGQGLRWDGCTCPTRTHVCPTRAVPTTSMGGSPAHCADVVVSNRSPQARGLRAYPVICRCSTRVRLPQAKESRCRTAQPIRRRRFVQRRFHRARGSPPRHPQGLARLGSGGRLLEQRQGLGRR